MMKMTASDLMTPNVLSVQEAMTVAELAAFLIDHEITGAAVRNDDDDLVGVVSVVDIASHVRERLDIVGSAAQPDFYVRGWEDTFNKDEMLEFHIENAGLLVRDIMNPRIYAVSADATISEVAREMLNGHLHRILVTRGGDLVGIISTSDFLKLFLEGERKGRRFPTGEVTEGLGSDAPETSDAPVP